MLNRFQAHFDGKVLIPDEPVSLPLNQAIELQVIGTHEPNAKQMKNVADRLATLQVLAESIRGPAIPLEMLRREALYNECA